jgi:hypothetical protein
MINHTPYRISRRSFMSGVGAGALAQLLRRAEARAEGAAEPPRLLVLHRPNGTYPPRWFPEADGADFVLPPLLKPFEALRSQMTVLSGVRVDKGMNHQGCLVRFMTGEDYKGTRKTVGGDVINQVASFDQVLLNKSPQLQGTPVRSLQVAADRRCQVPNNVSLQVMSYTGVDEPLLPEGDPLKVYQVLFSTLVRGGNKPQNAEALVRLRARQRSVLDFALRDMSRLSGLAPASQRPMLDAYAAAVRELEQFMDRAEAVRACQAPPAPAAAEAPTSRTPMAVMTSTCEVMAELVRTAFVCDLTRVVTFFWAMPGSSAVYTGLTPGMGAVDYHRNSHADITKSHVIEFVSAIDLYYSQRTADFVRKLADTPLAGGQRLLDRMAFLYANEVDWGVRHTAESLPLLLFGGRALGFSPGRHLRFSARPAVDLWAALGGRLGVPLRGKPLEGV